MQKSVTVMSRVNFDAEFGFKLSPTVPDYDIWHRNGVVGVSRVASNHQKPT
jgi:hypothetical protein